MSDNNESPNRPKTMKAVPLVRMVWITPAAESLITYMARVSNPENQNAPAARLISYLIRNRHWSPFEMADMCVEINTTRDISRQLLRHGKAFRFQEFSQRYADVRVLPSAAPREARMQHPTNRQASVACEDADIAAWWAQMQDAVAAEAHLVYQRALDKGIAKEVARVVLPEGMTPTRLYMKGDIRSWLHFCNLRMGNGTQKETMAIASACFELLRYEMRNIVLAWDMAND